jgi:uncharacterized protein YegL
VTVTLNGETGLAGEPEDIMLVLDRSFSMNGAPLAALKSASNTFVDIIDEATDGALDGTIANGSRIGVVSFSDNATLDQALTDDANAVKTAINALVVDNNTNHAAAIQAAQNELAGSAPTNTKDMIIMTDGVTTVGGNGQAEAAAARAAGTEIFAIGLESSAGIDVAQLNGWATDPDSAHVFLAPTPADLEDIFEAIGAAITVPAATNITVVDTVASHFSVSGPAASKGAVLQVGNVLTWTIDELGTESVTLTYTVTHDPAQPGGVEAVNTSVTYNDTEGHVVTFPSPTVNVRGCPATIDLEPDLAINELGTPGQTHTVTATVSDDFGDPVQGVTVDFDILSGPNAGAAGSGATDASGEVDFTYAATQGLAGLGTDEIRGCFVNGQGHDVCDTVFKRWQDTTPPEAACTPTNNPAGENVPPASNEDGFFELTAVDAVDPNPQIFVRDSASSAEFGPFPSGTKIELTQAPGATPDIKPGTGDIDWKIKLKGDALLVAVDASGNESDPITCLVPPPPK